MEDTKRPILHVLVVGFHHKKGCQVEYSFPPLVPGSPNECPIGWKYLPTLALPDGSHNYENDTTFFHLPSLTNPKKTIYGISCFRQIPTEKLKNLTEDITRGTVQKSVCVLSSLPLYGHIEVKMALITHAYFDEGDFSKVSLLEDTYHHLNACLTQNNSPLQNFVGLSARNFILQWRHKAVLLYKLLLLERRLIFFKSPVQPLCTSILTLLSLHPGMIESGLEQSACIKLSRPMSPMPDFEEESYDCPTYITKKVTEDADVDVDVGVGVDIDIDVVVDVNGINHIETQENNEDESNTNSLIVNTIEVEEATKTDDTGVIDIEEGIDVVLGELEEKTCLPRESSMDTIADANAHDNMTSLTHVNIETCGIPLPLFTQGYLCLPYLSLPYIDLLGDVNVRGYVVGATNVLFKQKRQMSDVLIEIDGTRIESQDPELRRQLHLTTEDLRFADFVVKHVAEEKHDVFLDGVGWEGSDEWIRAQFRVYLLSLLRTSLLQDGSREIEHFNSSFISAWKDTHNYKMWISSDHHGILEANPGHPFAGQLSVADMKLRFSHTMQNTESGRKINQAMASTGRAVATTGRAVGGAISQAKGALTNWWSNLLVSPDNRPAICEGEDVLNTNEKDDDVNNKETCQNADNQVPVLSNNNRNLNSSEQNIPETVEIENDVILNTKTEENDDIPYETGGIQTV